MDKNQKIEKIKSLLANSLLAEEIKNAILKNLEKFSDENLDAIIKSLEIESDELDKLSKLLANFDRRVDKNWQDLENKQKESAEEMIKKELAQHIK